MKRRRFFQTGDILLVPILDETERLAVMVVAQVAKSRDIGALFFVGSCKPTVSIDDAIQICDKREYEELFLVGPLGFTRGSWRIIGAYPNFDPNKWRLPVFVSDLRRTLGYAEAWKDYEPLFGVLDDELTYLIRIAAPPGDPQQYRQNSICGYKAVEAKLRNIVQGFGFTTSDPSIAWRFAKIYKKPYRIL